MNEKDTLLELVRRYLDGAATAEETQTLEALIMRDPAIRREFLRYAHLDAALAGNLRPTMFEGVLRSARQTAQASVKPRSRWLQWRPLAAAAAGLVIGLLCASVVFAYVGTSLGKVVTLLNESFESGPAPLAKGVPVEPGVWSGDYTEVVGEQQGVKPASGRKMLRVLRTDYEGKPEVEENRVGDIYRLIDLRPYRQEFADGSAVVQASAAFNAVEFAGGKFLGRMAIYAFDAESVSNGALHAVGPLRAWHETSLAAAKSGKVLLDRDPVTWQRQTCDLRLPANTDFLLIHLMIPAKKGTSPERVFAGHYIDDVRLTLSHSPLPSK